MYHIYVLQSEKHGKRYVGQTRKSVEERLFEHNSGRTKWTHANGPFFILYTEEYETRSEAMQREKFLKSGQGRKRLSMKLASVSASCLSTA